MGYVVKQKHVRMFCVPSATIAVSFIVYNQKKKNLPLKRLGILFILMAPQIHITNQAPAFRN